MKVHQNLPLSSLTYYHIGGNAKYVLEVSSVLEVHEALAFIRKEEIERVQILGFGANILLPDEDFDGAILWLHGNGSAIESHGDKEITVFAGESMDSLIQFSFNQDLVGLEWAGGLPSSVGGAVRGNAGAFGAEIKDIVQKVEAVNFTQGDDIRVFTNDECHFSYRNSYFKENQSFLITSVTFTLRKGTDEEVDEARKIYEKNILYRKTHHPMEYPSCGSVFMNVVKPDEVEKILSIWPDVRELSEGKWHKKISMGYVIDRLGFTGKRIGDAQVSPKHSNYIVNLGNAKAQDVEDLIEEIKNKFYDTFGFYPTPEVMIPYNT